MPVFEYSALNSKGKQVSGIIDAESVTAARQKLRSTQMFPVSIKETRDTSLHKESRGFSLGNLFKRVRPAEITMMTRQLATLVGAGFPLVSALDTLLPQTKSPGFKKILARLKNAVVEGNSFANALSLYSGVFSSVYINMVHAGETSGTLEIVLDRLADITEKQQALTTRIRSALAYPVLMALVGTLVLFLLLTYIVPSITTIFRDMNQALPVPTQLLITVSDLSRRYWWILLMGVAAAFVLLQAAKKSERGRHKLDQIKLGAPLIGGLVRKLAVARFARTLGSLLENGVPMLSALDIVKNVVGNDIIARAVEEAAREVGKGQGLGNSLSTTVVFPSLSIQMIQVGEQTGELENMLGKIAQVYENEVETTVMSLTALLEPVMILVMGVVVGFIVLSVCLPIFEMNQLIR